MSRWRLRWFCTRFSGNELCCRGDRGYYRLSPETYNGPGIAGGLFARRSAPLFAADSTFELGEYNGLGFAVPDTSPAWRAPLPAARGGAYLAITGRLACKAFNGIRPTAIRVVRRT
jgi:hypothetical protein